MKIISYLFILFGLIFLVFALVDTIELTSEQAILNYIIIWLPVISCFLIGGVLIVYANNHLPEGKIFYMHKHQTEGDLFEWSNWPDLRVRGQLVEPPNVGDILIYNAPSDKRLKFQFVHVNKIDGPKNMFFTDVKLIGEIKKPAK